MSASLGERHMGRPKMDQAARTGVTPECEFELEQFFPYKVRLFYSDVTQALSAIYQRDHDLSPAEWRTMAILGAAPQGLQASEIVSRSSMDKVVVSRAVKRMENRALLTRHANAADGRSFLLKLSEKGRAAMKTLHPNCWLLSGKCLAAWM